MADRSRGITVGFDAKRLTRNRTGLGNYSRFVADSLARFAPEVTQIHSASSLGNPELYAALSDCPSFQLVTPKRSGMPFSDYVWRNYTSAKPLLESGIRLFHGLSNELPASINRWGIPSLVTMHDLIYELFPEYYSPIDVRLYRHKYRRSCLDADRIVAVSACTKRDLIRLYGIEEDKIEVVYQGCDPVFAQEIPHDCLEAVRRSYDLPPRFILSVGTIEERKNTRLIVEALPILEDKGIRLVLVGRETKYAEQVRRVAEKLHVSERLTILSSVPFRDLPAIYRLAEVFVYPSLYEGFGIPILESLNAGIPVVAATGSCLEEAGGPFSLYADPHSPEDLAHRIESVSNLRGEMIVKGKEWAKQFRPEVLGPRLAGLYQQMIYPNK